MKKYYWIAIVVALIGTGVAMAAPAFNEAQLTHDIGEYEGAMGELERENILDRTLKAELILKNQAELEAIIERQNGEVNVVDNRIADRSFQWREYKGFLLVKEAELKHLLGNQ